MSDQNAKIDAPAAPAVETTTASETPEAQVTNPPVEPAPAPAVAQEATPRIPVAAAAAPVAATLPVPSAPASAPAAEAPIDKETTATKEPAEEVTPENPLSQLWATAKAVDYPEIWGVALANPETHVPSQIVLQKYLNANDGDLVKAKDQLTKTLEWRAKTKPLELVKKHFPRAKFEGLGFVTTYLNDAGATDPENKEVFTWNIYGGVKSIDETFGDLELFIEWRVALMELALQELSLSTATKPITAEHDPYKMVQVHDYKSISFLRQSPHVKAASTETIKVFAQNYPELLKEKFFVNVPAIMGFVYAFMKLFVAAKTIKKFHPMSNGANLVHEFVESKVATLGEKLPKEYGGKGSELKEQGSGPLLN